MDLQKRIMILIFCLIITCSLILSETVFVYASNNEDEIYESFWEYEKSDPYSAWNTWLNNCEDSAIMETIDVDEVFKTLKDVFDAVNGSINISEEYESVYDDAFFQGIDVTNRLINNMPFIKIFPPQILATVFIDYINFKSNAIKNSIVYDIGNVIMYNILSRTKLFDSTGKHNASVRYKQHTESLIAKMFIGAIKIVNRIEDFLNELTE